MRKAFGRIAAIILLVTCFIFDAAVGLLVLALAYTS
jgi:hypothetical protein